MQNLIDDLKDLLQQDESFFADGKLLKSKVSERALRLDPGLLKLLLSAHRLKQLFFQEVEGLLIFDQVKFLQFVEDEEIPPGNFTAYTTKTGRTVDCASPLESDRVFLTWPGKGTYAGDRSQEDGKGKPAGGDAALAPGEVDGLSTSIPLQHFKRYTRNGVEQPESLEAGFNLLVKGNNLLALQAFRKPFFNSVKLIYIDPPYNTGGSGFGYHDRFPHRAWLAFFQDRVAIAKDLLCEDGSIWVHLDDVEAHYAKVLCDEIFGRENFLANVIWQKKYAPQNDARFFSDNHDHILVYAKNVQRFHLNLLPRSQEMNSRYKNPDNDPRGPWASDNLLVKTYSAACDYPITNPTGRVVNPPRGSCWRVSRSKFEELKADNRIWFGQTGKNVPRLKRFLSEVKPGTTPLTIWSYKEVGHNQEARRELFALVDTNIFQTPKPERLIKRIVELATDAGDIVLDFFVGSGTTAAVAMKMNRRFLACEQMDYCDTVTLERLKKVIAGEQGGISKEVGWQGGGSFIYCELTPPNPGR